MTTTVLRPPPREIIGLPADGSFDVHADQPTALGQPVGCFCTDKARADMVKVVCRLGGAPADLSLDDPDLD